MAPRSHLFQGYRWFSAFMVYIVLSLASIDSVVVTVEKPWEEETKAKVDFKSVENFNRLEEKDYRQYKTGFNTGFYTGVYHTLSAAHAGFYGGAGGTGFYAYNQKGAFVELKINKTNSTQNKPLNYFGLLVGALKKWDHLVFYYQKKPIFDFSLELIYNKIYRQGDYWYNQHFASATRAYAFVFINFFFDDGEYDEVHFVSPNDWFCSDNHYVGTMKALWGTEVYRGKLKFKFPPTKPSLPPTKPSLPPTKPSLPPTEPSLPPTKPSLPPTKPSLPPTEPSPPPTEPSPPPTEPSPPPTEPSPPPTEPSLPPTKPSPPTPETSPPTPETSPPTPETIPTRVEPPKGEPSVPRAESEIKRAPVNGVAAATPTPSSSTTTKAELIPFICIAWITVDVILATVALE